MNGNSSESRWKRAGIVSGATVVAVGLLGVVADLVGILDYFGISPTGEPTPTVSASNIDQTTNGGQATGDGDDGGSGNDNGGGEQTSAGTPDPEWTLQAEDFWMDMDTGSADDSGCTPKLFDLDSIESGAAHSEWDWSVHPHIDLVWDHCSNTGVDEVRLDISGDARGFYYETGTDPSAEQCAEDIADSDAQVWLDLYVWEPSLWPGEILCLQTDEDRIVLAEVATVDPAQEGAPMYVSFYGDLWVRE